MADICAVKNKKPHLTKEERFPRCYKDVSKVLKTVKSCKGNLKTVLYNSKLRGAYLKKVQGLASNVLKNYQTVAKVIERVDLLKKEPLLQLECVEVMVYELILGMGTLVGHSKPIEAVKKYHREVMDAFEAIGSESTSEWGSRSLPRYARVNTLVTTPHDVWGELQRLGYERVEYGDSLSQEQYLELIRDLRSPQFVVDHHFQDMLVFPAGENLCQLKMYQKGKILLQDKSSYIPVKALDPEPGSVVLDACAAPGMKTIHIASMMQHQGVLLAYEKDADRFATLQKMIQQYDIQTCETFNQDFKSSDPADGQHSKVRYILLDPSCSGSGMVNRMDSATDRPDSKSESRLRKLAGFQIVLLKHALRFPNVQRVVYSTCSIHEEENEFVVREALGAFKDRFRLVPVLPEWPTRGSDGYEFGELCLRSYPEENATNGFFVAAFERADSSEGHLSQKRRSSKQHRSESRVEEKEPEPTDDVSNSNNRDDGIRDNSRESRKRKKHPTDERENEVVQDHLEPGALDCEDYEFSKSKRSKKKRRSETGVGENEHDRMDGASNSNYEDDGIGDDRRESRKKKKGEAGERMQQNHLEPRTKDWEDKEMVKSKKNKRKHRSEAQVDVNEHNLNATTERESAPNSFWNRSHEDEGIDDDCFKNQKRKKHKKNRKESEHFELLGCHGKETSLDEKKVGQRSDTDEKENLSELGMMSEKESEAHCRKKKKKLVGITPSQTESPEVEQSVREKKKKHKTKSNGEETWTRNEPADSPTFASERIPDAEPSDSAEKLERRHTRKYDEENEKFNDESVACTARDSKEEKKKRKKQGAETDESTVYQENQSGDGAAEGIPLFKKHKKHKKKNKRSHSPKPDE